MNKTAVIYWSGTGNTQAMAEAVAQGAGGQLFAVSEISAAEAAAYDALALGCPAMGDEVLEENEFEPFFSELENSLAGKKVALFGSYGWGDGQWMRDWKARADGANAVVYQDEGLILNEAPDEEGLAQCRAFGAGFARD